MNTLQPLETIEFEMPRRDNAPTRKVQQELRMAKLTLHPPTGRRGSLRCHPVTVTVLLAKEINTPAGEKPVVWWLMTSIPIAELQPSQLILWYLCRWQIEVFFKILKSGCQIERLQLETANRTKNCPIQKDKKRRFSLKKSIKSQQQRCLGSFLLLVFRENRPHCGF